MRFGEIYRRATDPVLSIEVYPPRTEKARASFERALPRLVALDPDFMTVTYGAMGSTRDETVEIAGRIRREFSRVTASHFTCVGSTRAEIDETLDSIRDAGIENIVALRGDPPEGEEEFVAPEGGFAHANELVDHLRRRGDFDVAVAGYPEKHIEAVDMETDLRFLRTKVDAGADLIITQLFFDNRFFFEFEERVRALGIDVPVVPGILPPMSLAQVEKLTSMCGATVPDGLRRSLAEAGDDRTAVQAAGAAWATRQVAELVERGVDGVHFYVLNRAAQMEGILGELRSEGLL